MLWIMVSLMVLRIGRVNHDVGYEYNSYILPLASISDIESLGQISISSMEAEATTLHGFGQSLSPESLWL